MIRQFRSMSLGLLAISNLDEFDKSVDPTLAGTLAGLALAAATFLIAFRVNIAEKVKRIRLDEGTPKAEDEWTLNAINTAVAFLVASFYFFVVLLVESLTVDEWVEPHALLSRYRDWALPSDVGLAGGTLAIGIVLLALGAKEINSLVPHRTSAALLGRLPWRSRPGPY